MTDEEFNRIISEVVRDTLTSTVVLHKRRCAIAAGVRESIELEAGCDHKQYWDQSKHWCNRCGVTLSELVRRHKERGLY